MTYTGAVSWSAARVSSPVVSVLQTDVFPFHQRRVAEEAGAAPAIPWRGAWLATTCGQRTIRVSSREGWLATRSSHRN